MVEVPNRKKGDKMKIEDITKWCDGGTPTDEPTGELEPLSPADLQALDPALRDRVTKYVDAFAQAKEMRVSADQKFKEASQLREDAAQTKALADKMREENLALQQEMITALQQPPKAEEKPTELPNFSDDPNAAFAALVKEMTDTKGSVAEVVSGLKDFVKGETDITKNLVADLVYQRHLEKEVYPKYPDVSKEDIDGWITKHPNTPVNEKTIARAAQEVQDSFSKRVEGKVSSVLEEKAKLAEQAAEQPGEVIAQMKTNEEFIKKDQLGQEKDNLELIKDLIKARGMG
jgi:hypothetical protein